ncbi:MAG: rRNA maturation RNase YbeY [Paracoccaceae bacterium]
MPMTPPASQMPDLIDVVIEDARWDILDLTALANRAALGALNITNIPADGYEICVMACDDAQIMQLNTDFRETPRATNVLSWPAFDLAPEKPGEMPMPAPQPPESLGDIAIAFETCQREAAEKSIPLKDHVTHLLLHGCLHLLGFDHETARDAEIMEGLEIKALASMGVSNPY